jgi:hypothetical protein
MGSEKTMINKISNRVIALTVLCLLLGVGQVFAQSQASSGQINGVVTDSTGAVVPNATIKLVNKNTGTEKNTVSNSSGVYQFILLQPGNYTVTASGSGFSDQNLEVTVNVGRTVNANFALGAGDVSAVVNVTGEEVQTTVSQPDAVLDNEAIKNLPINGRRFQDFATLTPTVQVDDQRGQLSISGQRGINSNISVDGTDYSQPFFGGIRGGERSNFGFTLPQESVREFQVIASGYSAEFGRSSGGIVSVVTKNGTNDFSGSAFYVIRPESISRPHEYAKAVADSAGIDSPQIAPTRQQFGGSFGGPLVKDKLFFFGSYEQQIFKVDRFVFFEDLRGSSIANPAPPLTAGEQEVLSYFQSLEETFQQTNDVYAGLARIDWNINQANALNFRFNTSYNKALNAVNTGETAIDPTTNQSLSNNGVEKDRTYTFVTQLVSTLSANMVNEFRGQYSREERPRLANSSDPNVTTGIGRFGTRSFMPTTQFDTRLQLANNLTYFNGDHTAKFGFDYNRIHADQDFGFNQFGRFFVFPSGSDRNVLSSLSSDITATSFGRFDDLDFNDYTKQVGNLAAAFTVTELAFFAQDSYRAANNFTFNFGMRLSQQYNPSPELGNDALINEVRNATYPLLGNKSFDPTQIPDSGWEWGPRVGFAYDMFSNGKSVIRGFAGIYYARTPMLLLAGPFNNYRTTPGDLSVNFPSLPGTFNQAAFDAANPQYTAIVGPGVTPNTVYRYFAVLGIDLNQFAIGSLPVIDGGQIQSISQALLAASPGSGTDALGVFRNSQPFGVAEDYRNPRSTQFGLGYEAEIADNLVVGVDYSQVNTDFLERNQNINIGLPSGLAPQSRRPTYNFGQRPVTSLGDITLRASTARSQYQALTFRARYKTDFAQFNAFYVLSRNLSDDDNERSSGGFTYADPFNLISEYNYSDLDRRHQFTANPVVFLPFGFNVSSTIRLRSGRPVDAVIGSNVNGNSNTVDRPYIAPGVPLERNSFRNNPIYQVDLRVQKGFNFDERKKLILTADLFNVFNLSNIQISGGATTRYCAVRNEACGLNGATNPNFLKTRDSNGNLITFANSAGSEIFQTQFGARFEF